MDLNKALTLKEFQPGAEVLSDEMASEAAQAMNFAARDILNNGFPTQPVHPYLPAKKISQEELALQKQAEAAGWTPESGLDYRQFVGQYSQPKAQPRATSEVDALRQDVANLARMVSQLVQPGITATTQPMAMAPSCQPFVSPTFPEVPASIERETYTVPKGHPLYGKGPTEAHLEEEYDWGQAEPDEPEQIPGPNLALVANLEKMALEWIKRKDAHRAIRGFFAQSIHKYVGYSGWPRHFQVAFDDKFKALLSNQRMIRDVASKVSLFANGPGISDQGIAGLFIAICGVIAFYMIPSPLQENKA